MGVHGEFDSTFVNGLCVFILGFFKIGTHTGKIQRRFSVLVKPWNP